MAATLDGPWVVKVASDTIEHKGRVGGVKIGLVDDDALRSAARDIAAGLAAHHCEDQADGYLVQQMVFGPEILVGLLSDPDGRRSLNLGVGGWAAEAYRDIATLLLPLGPDELDETLQHSAFGRLLSESHRVGLRAMVLGLGREFLQRSAEPLRHRRDQSSHPDRPRPANRRRVADCQLDHMELP